MATFDRDRGYGGRQPAMDEGKHVSLPRSRAALRFLEPRLPPLPAFVPLPTFVSYVLWYLSLVAGLISSVAACFHR